jgi:hypothetical protein
MFEEYDVVKLLIPTSVQWDGEEVELKAGLTGAVIGSAQDHSSYMVEFTDDEGETIAMVPISASSLELFWTAATESYADARSRKTAS